MQGQQQSYYQHPKLYSQNIIHQIQSPSSQGIYLPFGTETQKIKNYVHQQLHGSETIKNQQILKRFREEAMIRKHHYLTKRPMQNPEKLYHTLDQQRKVQYVNSSRFNNYIPQQFRYSPLIPTQKSPPPIAKYSRIEPRDISKRQKLSRLSLQTRSSLTTTVNNNKIPDIHIRRSSLPIEYIERRKVQRPEKEDFLNYRDRAIKKIKEIAKLKKEHPNLPNNEVLNISTDSSEIIEQLQQKRDLKKVQFAHLSKQLKRFKKYRKYINESKDHHLNDRI